MVRIHNFRVGLAQWRQAAIRRRGVALVAVVRVVPVQAVAANSCGLVAGTLGPVGSAPSIRIGEFVISPEGDPRILGHPQIRY